MLVLGQNYTAPNDKGMLLIAYPDKDVETEFEFLYFEDMFYVRNLTAEKIKEMREQAALESE